ncbi:MAG: DUF3024 domain-containing protein [Streptosporangiaceae bacterium]
MGTEWTQFPVARLRYTKGTGRWSLYWRDRNLRFHIYDRTGTGPMSWRLSGTSRSASSAWPVTPASPPRSAATRATHQPAHTAWSKATSNVH